MGGISRAVLVEEIVEVAGVEEDDAVDEVTGEDGVTSD